MNPLFGTSKPKPKKKAAQSPEIDKPFDSVNSIDLLKFSAKDIKNTAVEQSKQVVSQAWEQLLGIEHKSSGPVQMDPNVEYSPSQIAKMQEAQKEQPKHIETTAEHSQYVREIMGNATMQRESGESEQRIQSLIVELRRLASSVQAVEKAVVLQAIGPGSAKTMKGKYYESFFEWMLLVVQDARRKVEDSGAWLQTMTAKSKKGQAVGKVKKSMNLLLSGERTAQNQSG